MTGCAVRDGQSAPPGGATLNVVVLVSPPPRLPLNCQVEFAWFHPVMLQLVRHAVIVALLLLGSVIVSSGATTPLRTPVVEVDALMVSTFVLLLMVPVMAAPKPHAPLKPRLFCVSVKVVPVGIADEGGGVNV